MIRLHGNSGEAEAAWKALSLFVRSAPRPLHPYRDFAKALLQVLPQSTVGDYCVTPSGHRRCSRFGRKQN